MSAILDCADPGLGLPQPLSRLPDPTHVARYVRDRDQQRWRRCVDSNPLAPTIQVGVTYPSQMPRSDMTMFLRLRATPRALSPRSILEPSDLNVPIRLVEPACDSGCHNCHRTGRAGIRPRSAPLAGSATAAGSLHDSAAPPQLTHHPRRVWRAGGRPKRALDPTQMTKLSIGAYSRLGAMSTWRDEARVISRPAGDGF